MDFYANLKLFGGWFGMHYKCQRVRLRQWVCHKMQMVFSQLKLIAKTKGIMQH